MDKWHQSILRARWPLCVPTSVKMSKHCKSTVRVSENWPQPVTWTHPFFIYHQTPEGRALLPLCLCSNASTMNIITRQDKCKEFNRQTDLSSKVTAPATTGDATLVPDKDLHPPLHQPHTQSSCLFSNVTRTFLNWHNIHTVYELFCCKAIMQNRTQLYNTYCSAEPRTDEPYVTISGFTRP